MLYTLILLLVVQVDMVNLVIGLGHKNKYHQKKRFVIAGRLPQVQNNWTKVTMRSAHGILTR